MTKEIADAFGLPQDSLEMVEFDENMNKTARCQSCEEWALRYAELEAMLAKCRREVATRSAPNSCGLMSGPGLPQQ